MLESLPKEQLRKALEALPETQMRKAIEQSWREQSGFSDSETLAGLIRPLEPLSKKRR